MSSPYSPSSTKLVFNFCEISRKFQFFIFLIFRRILPRIVLWLSILLKFIWYGHHHPRHVLVASNRPPFVLIRPYIRIRATLLRIAASAKLPHVILRIIVNRAGAEGRVHAGQLTEQQDEQQQRGRWRRFRGWRREAASRRPRQNLRARPIAYLEDTRVTTTDGDFRLNN